MNKAQLKQVAQFLGPLSASAHRALEQQAQFHRFSKGQVIIDKGQAIGGVYLMLAGQLCVYTLDDEANQKQIYSLLSGEMCIFSINCSLKQVVYPAWVRVDSDMAEVISLPTALFQQLYQQEQSVQDRVVEALSQRVFDLMTVIEEATTQDLGSRINSFLVRQCGHDGLVKLSHQDIAISLGTAREVVSRHLKKMEKQGLLKLSRMKIEILQAQALAKY